MTLYDLHCLKAVHPPETYKFRVHRRIDFMLGPAGVCDTICRSGFLAFDSGVISDHHGLFVDLDFMALLCLVDAIASPPARRGSRSEDQRAVDSYTAVFNAYADDDGGPLNCAIQASRLASGTSALKKQKARSIYMALYTDCFNDASPSILSSIHLYRAPMRRNSNSTGRTH